VLAFFEHNRMTGANRSADTATVTETHIDSGWFIVGDAENCFNGAFSRYGASFA
jgi:hypothetical protein